MVLEPTVFCSNLSMLNKSGKPQEPQHPRPRPSVSLALFRVTYDMPHVGKPLEILAVFFLLHIGQGARNATSLGALLVWF